MQIPNNTSALSKRTGRVVALRTVLAESTMAKGHDILDWNSFHVFSSMNQLF